MKFKDIEKKLKREQENNSVPDVFDRAAGAPLNKLLSGESPSRLFNRRAATLMLCLVLALVLIISVALFALTLSEDEPVGISDCYVAINVERGGANTRYGLIIGEDYKVKFSTVELENDALNIPPTVCANKPIKDFITLNYGDKVSIYAVCEESERAADVAAFAARSLMTGFLADVPAIEGDETRALAKLKEYMNLCGVETENMPPEKLVEAYIEL